MSRLVTEPDGPYLASSHNIRNSGIFNTYKMNILTSSGRSYPDIGIHFLLH